MEKLKEKITESGYKLAFLASKLGLSRYGLALKLNGTNEFTVYEAVTLSNLLGLSKDDIIEIFFSQKVD